jgi:hypothetical protein
MATTKTQKKSTPTKKKTSSKKVSLSPNSITDRFKVLKPGVSYELLHKHTDAKGKYDTVSRKKDKFNKSNVHTNTKEYTAYGRPRYEVTSSNYDINAPHKLKTTKHFEKSIDTTGFAAGKKNFTVVSKQKLPGGNMYKTTKSKTDRKGALDTINRMKKRARKPFTSSKATSSKRLTTKKK